MQARRPKQCANRSLGSFLSLVNASLAAQLPAQWGREVWLLLKRAALRSTSGAAVAARPAANAAAARRLRRAMRSTVSTKSRLCWASEKDGKTSPLSPPRLGTSESSPGPQCLRSKSLHSFEDLICRGKSSSLGTRSGASSRR